jgi:Na+/H+ antiporter NhaD/arsenite permease-like protein
MSAETGSPIAPGRNCRLEAPKPLKGTPARSVAALPDPRRAWLVVAMSATLAGNLTILGSVANLIVVQRADRSGLLITFWQYLRVGAPLTVLTILVGLVWL